jgi:hypothetical protein
MMQHGLIFTWTATQTPIRNIIFKLVKW